MTGNWGQCPNSYPNMSAVDFIQALHPDMVLFDIGRQEANGSTSVKKFHAKFPQLPIIILSLNDDA